MNLYHTSGLRCTLNTSLTNTLNKINESLFLVTNGCHIWRLPDLLVVISQTSRHPFSLKTSPGPPIRVLPCIHCGSMWFPPKPGSVPVHKIILKLKHLSYKEIFLDFINLYFIYNRTNGCHIWRLPDLLVVISQTSRKSNLATTGKYL
jgi:DUF917 family protein